MQNCVDDVLALLIVCTFGVALIYLVSRSVSMKYENLSLEMELSRVKEDYRKLVEEFHAK